MIKTSKSTKSIIKSGKNGIGVGDDGDNGNSYSSDSNRNSTDAPKSICSPALYILMLRTSS